MRTYGLIGYPLSHSFSPGYFNDKFEKENIDAVYKLFPLQQISEFPQLIRNHPDLYGLNVTIPYKEQILPYLSSIKGDAFQIQAVNTLAFDRSFSTLRLIGYNTDAYGFEMSLFPHLKEYHSKALILGTGGTSKTVSFVLRKLGIEYLFVTRRKQDISSSITYDEITPGLIKEYKLIINTTPLGMYPNTSEKPNIIYETIGDSHLLYDLIYNPSLTSFLQEGKSRGAGVENGLKMLRIQAEQSWYIWNTYHS
jgi:shikimate dehydrogenase